MATCGWALTVQGHAFQPVQLPFLWHSQPLPSKQTSQEPPPYSISCIFRAIPAGVVSSLKNSSGIHFQQHSPPSHPKESNSFFLKAQLQWLQYWSSNSRLPLGRVFGKSPHSKTRFYKLVCVAENILLFLNRRFQKFCFCFTLIWYILFSTGGKGLLLEIVENIHKKYVEPCHECWLMSEKWPWSQVASRFIGEVWYKDVCFWKSFMYIHYMYV